MKIDPSKFIVEAYVGEKCKPIDNILDIEYTVEILRRDGEIVSHKIKDVLIEYIDDYGILKTIYGPSLMFRFTKVNPLVPRKQKR
ncbi:hypothetical protein [Acetobacterium carbinolicum]|uniref:hypothetical protein n=1 Tax=Acetobacterium carbinolicum TaxID=52690 RepID=UPI0039C9C961